MKEAKKQEKAEEKKEKARKAAEKTKDKEEKIQAETKAKKKKKGGERSSNDDDDDDDFDDSEEDATKKKKRGDTYTIYSRIHIHRNMPHILLATHHSRRFLFGPLPSTTACREGCGVNRNRLSFCVPSMHSIFVYTSKKIT